ncbi:SDR family NAD(P)-dependent oxidoreductase [Sediminimonas sp.]|uniref:SDR family NAD(P)-dependent oxidoreductase n=1 Tax=Sediminimonas sp. TaxID=2823379 RepID=UPI0025DD0B02|nr:SDR family oxidoreductase [Sediminimonas sp.]
MTQDFSGKTAIVTGGGSGIGAAICRQLAAGGATVIVADLNTGDAQAVADAITQEEGAALVHTVDTAEPAQVEAMVARAEADTGALHLLVNNAGIGGTPGPVGEYPLEDWHKLIGINLNGVFYGMRYGLPAIERAGGGAIVNMASILGSVGFANAGAYVAAKHGVVGLTKVAAMEYAQRGIRVNAVGPGFINTPLLENNLDAETLAAIAGMHPVGRLGTADEVANLACFLLGDGAGFITGSYHLVDGGYTAQ